MLIPRRMVGRKQKVPPKYKAALSTPARTIVSQGLLPNISRSMIFFIKNTRE